MPIEVKCAGCESKFRVPDKAAGEKIKCPKCQGVIAVPAADSAPASSTPASSAPASSTPASSAPASSAPASSTPAAAATPQPAAMPQAESSPGASPERWHVKMSDGETYGPVSMSELEEWVKESRLDGDTQLLQDGGDQWQWATDVFPQLSAEQTAAASAQQPVASPQQPAASPQQPAAASAEPSVGPFATAPETAPAADDNPFAFAAADASPMSRLRGGKSSSAPAVAPSNYGAPSPTPSTYGAPAAAPGEYSDKSKTTAALLGIFLGAFGVHRFFLGYSTIGIIQILVTTFTCGLGGIWGGLEGWLILFGAIDKDADGRKLR